MWQQRIDQYAAQGVHKNVGFISELSLKKYFELPG